MMTSNMRWIVAVCTFLSLASCSSAMDRPEGEPDIKLTLIVKDSNHQFLPGVRVYSVSRDTDEIDLGVTNDAGLLLVPVRLMTSPGFLALIACKEGFYCGALRNDQELRLAAQHSRLIHLELTPLTIH